VPWIRRFNVYIWFGRSYNIYFLWLGESSRNQRKLGGQRNHRTEYPQFSDISLNDLSFTSMTVHMETVYAADKNVTGFDFLDSA
jgi:hypothetical protein